MSKARGVGRIRGKGTGGKPMEGQEMATSGPNPAAMQVVAEDTIQASATALGGQAPAGVCPSLSLRASLPGDGQHWPPDATRRNVATLPTPEQASSPGRRVLEQTQAHSSPERREVLQQV